MTVSSVAPIAAPVPGGLLRAATGSWRSMFWLLAVLPPLFLVVASRGLVSANATVLGVKRAPAAGAASAVLGACMFGGGILVSPLALGGKGSAVPMAAIVAGGAVAALAATVVLTHGDHPEPAVDSDAAVLAQPIEEWSDFERVRPSHRYVCSPASMGVVSRFSSGARGHAHRSS
jgi:hypothetical protein